MIRLLQKFGRHSSEHYPAQKTFPHGIHPPELKEVTHLKEIKRFPFPPVVMVPMSQHIGAPAKVIVREKQEVRRGQLIAEPGGFVSVAMHSPVSGIVERIGFAPTVSGKLVQTVYIKPHPGSSQEIPQYQPKPFEEWFPDEIISAIQAAGIVGMGGAAFPTHVKLKVPPGKTVDTLLINGIECEPYLTTDHRVMLEESAELFMGVQLTMKALSVNRAIIGIEANKPDAITFLKDNIPAGSGIEVEAVQVKYPQGAEKMLIKALLNREVPSGGLPADANVVVSNVATMAEVGKLLPNQQGLIERVITITGPGVTKPGNYRIPLGASLRYVLEQAGLKNQITRVILGGPMMGNAVASLDIPVTKGTSGITVLTEEETSVFNQPEYACIRCGHCVDACPMYLNPSKLGILSSQGEYDRMTKEFHLMDCFECGSCSFVCPSNIPLVQKFRIAKSYLRDYPQRKKVSEGSK